MCRCNACPFNNSPVSSLELTASSTERTVHLSANPSLVKNSPCRSSAQDGLLSGSICKHLCQIKVSVRRQERGEGRVNRGMFMVKEWLITLARSSTAAESLGYRFSRDSASFTSGNLMPAKRGFL